MGWVARIAAPGAALSFVACAMIAGLDDPAELDLTSSGDGGLLEDTSSGSSSGGGTSSSSSGSDGAANDAPADVLVVDACGLAKNGDFCTQASACCSTKCGEARECVNSCTAGGGFCNPTSMSSCCFGFWCNGQCAACIAPNQPAAQPAGFPVAHSCCSRSLKIGDLNTCQ